MHECLLQIELMDLELVSGSKSNHLAADTATPSFNKTGILNATKSAFVERHMLNLFPKSQLHFLGELFLHMEAVITLYPKVMDYLALTTPYEVISGAVLGENALPEPNG